MSDFPSPAATATPLFVAAHGQYSSSLASAVQQNSSGLAGAARTWVANLVAYMPVYLPFPYPVKRAYWINGSTISSTNVDMGIYSADGTRIFNTGSTAMAGASSVQYVTVEWYLDAGSYYFAWTCNGTTNRGYALAGTALSGRVSGLLEETTGGFGLPATMTPVAWTRAWNHSCCGVTRTTAGF